MMTGWNIFPIFAVVAVALALAGSVVALCNKSQSRVAQWLAWSAVVVMAIFVSLLWVELSRPPLRTMGETRLWYSLFLLLSGAFTYQRWGHRWIPSFATMLATVFITINCLRPEIHDQTLMPALQSVWFVPHVTSYMFSYALLGCATLLALYQLFAKQSVEGIIIKLLYGGVAFFTIGMLTGAIWAKEAWGAYWSWDAKESWAAATWFLYLLAIHLHSLGRAERRLVALVTTLAFLCLQMCWYGINYLPSAVESVHVYNR